jgi:HAE1 family hydrophobic/amphiphilic exporter-1
MPFQWFGRLTGRLIRLSVVVIVACAGLTGLTAWQFTRAPTFHSDLDQRLITVLQLPLASLARTDATRGR